MRTFALLLSSAFASAFAVGCSSSVVLPANDDAFNYAQTRLERTAAIVEAAPPAERAAFMQAEAVYRYRFLTDGRGTAAVLAEAAAAITDLPVFQSYAGALDLVALRYQSADAATQLWETFLARHPNSMLHPLALYRLGWSYRSVGISGLPRSSDEAFDALAPTTLANLANEAHAVRWKSKDVATSLSLIPGLGQLYVGETGSGVARLAVALAAAAAIITPAIVSLSHPSELTWKHDWPLLVSATAGVIVLSFDYTSSYEDAGRAVVRFNERAERRFEALHPEAP
jgi:hypothetical protein